MNAQITGVILAGGQGRRMGGVDKGLQDLNGRPLAHWVLERLKPQVDTVLINANQNLARYREFGCAVVPDAIPGFAGPLAGLQAALTAATTPLIVTVPCDSPFLPTDLVTRLRAALQGAQADLAVPRAGDRAHRAFCLTRREVLPRLDAFLASGERKVGLWHASLKIVEVDFDDQADAFRNINTAAELAHCEQASPDHHPFANDRENPH